MKDEWRITLSEKTEEKRAYGVADCAPRRELQDDRIFHSFRPNCLVYVEVAKRMCVRFLRISVG